MAALFLLLSVEFGRSSCSSRRTSTRATRARAATARARSWPGAATTAAATVFGSLDAPRRVVELPGSPPTARFSTISLHGVHYVVWRDRSAVRMMRVSAKGALLDAAPVTIANAGRLGPREELSAPALATNGRGVLAAWVDGDVVRAATIAGGKAGTPLAVLSASDQVSGDRAPAAHDVQKFSRCRRHLVAGRRRRARALDGAGSADGLAARARLQARRRGRSAKP